jgi:hypothetical protein
VADHPAAVNVFRRRVVSRCDSWPLPFCLVASLCVQPGNPRQERFAPPSGGGQAATLDSDHPAEARAAIRKKADSAKLVLHRSLQRCRLGWWVKHGLLATAAWRRAACLRRPPSRPDPQRSRQNGHRQSSKRQTDPPPAAGYPPACPVRQSPGCPAMLPAADSAGSAGPAAPPPRRAPRPACRRRSGRSASADPAHRRMLSPEWQ